MSYTVIDKGSTTISIIYRGHYFATLFVVSSISITIYTLVVNDHHTTRGLTSPRGVKTISIIRRHNTMSTEQTKRMVFNTTDSELTKYSGTEVEVIRPLTDKECDIKEVGCMYKVRFHDGYERDAFEDELTPLTFTEEV